MASGFDTPRAPRKSLFRRPDLGEDFFGRTSEAVARFFGSPTFLVWLTLFCIVWLLWNTLAPERLRFDSASNGFTALTLMLSLQASYASPLILLAQNRQTDRDKVSAEQDRQRAERNLADTEFLAREIAGLRLAMGEVATRDFVRSEIRDLLEEIQQQDDDSAAGGASGDERPDASARPSSPESAGATTSTAASAKPSTSHPSTVGADQ